MGGGELANAADDDRLKDFVRNTETEWRPTVDGWRRAGSRNRRFYWLLVTATIGSGFLAAVLALVTGDWKLWVFSPQAVAGILGLVAGACRAFDAAVDPGEKGRFYGVITTESEIILSDLKNIASTHDEAVKLRSGLQEIQRKAVGGAPVGQGMQEISDMSKQLGQKQV